MKKLKLFVSSLIAMLAFAIFAVTGIKVKATTTFVFNANTGTLAANKKVIDNDDFAITCGKGLSLESCNTTWSKNSNTFSKVVLPSGGTNSASNGFSLTSKSENGTFGVYYSITNSSAVTGGTVSGGSATCSVTADDSAPTAGTAGYITFDVTANTAVSLYSSSNRLAIFAIDFTPASSATLESISVADGSQFAVGDTYSATNLVVTGNYSDSSSSPLSSSKYTYTITDPDGDAFDKTTAFTKTGTYTINVTTTTGSLEASATFTVVNSITYTITYHYNNGSANTTEEVTKGSKVVTPVPTKTDCAFAGWYSDEGLTTAFVTNSTTVNSDLDLYAKYVDYVTLPQGEASDNIVNISSLSDASGQGTVTSGIYTFYNSSNKITIEANNKTASGIAFTKRLKMGASGNVDSVYTSMHLTKGTLYVVCQTGNTATDGTLYLTDGTSTVSTSVFGQYALAFEFDITSEGDYKLYGSTSINYYYIEFVEAAAVTPTVTVTTVTGVDSDNKTAVAFVAKIENVTDVTLLTNMSFHLVATYGVAKEADYDVTTCYTALTAFGDANISGFDSKDNTYYVYFVVSGIEDKYDGLTLAVTFNASYDGVALTQTTFEPYTYTVSSQA